ncbi:MAG: hypothetical protein ACYC7L_13375 [Nitrospirota bacterium]
MFRDRYIYAELPALPPQAPYFAPEWSMADAAGRYCLDGPNAAKLQQNVRSLMDDNAWLRGMITDMQKLRDELARQEAKQEQADK